MQIAINLIFSVVIFVLIFYFVGFQNVVSSILHAKVEFLIIALGAYVVLNIVMSYRISVILKNIGANINTLQVFPSNLAGMLASDFTPARIGYFFTAFSMTSRNNTPLEKTMISIFGPQLFDFLIKIISAAIITWLILSKAGMDNIVINVIMLVVAATAIVCAGLVVFYPPFLSRLSVFERLPFVPKAFAFIRKMHAHSDGVLSIKGKIIGITLITWSIKGFEWLMLAKALGISFTSNIFIEFLLMMVIQAAVTIIQFLPIPTVAGAGVSEAGLAGILFAFGIPIESGVALGFLTRLLMITVDAFSLPVLLDYLHNHNLEQSLEEISGIH